MERNLVTSHDLCLLDSLLDELVLTILEKLELSQLWNLACVCTRWRQLTLKQEFWRFHAIKKWGESIVPNSYAFTSDSARVDFTKYLIPTYEIGNNTAVDWRKYFKIRYFFEPVKFALDRHYFFVREIAANPLGLDYVLPKERKIMLPEGYEIDTAVPGSLEVFDDVSWSDDSESEQELGEYLNEEDWFNDEHVTGENIHDNKPMKDYSEDLYTSSISTFFMRLPQRKKARISIPDGFPKLLWSFAMEIYPLLLEAKLYAELIVATNFLVRSTVLFFGIRDWLCKQLHDICLLVEDKPRLMLPLLFPICTVLDQSQTISQYQLDILKSVLNKLLDLTNSKKFAAANERFNEELREYVANFSEDSVQHAIIASFFEYIDPHILNKEEAKRKNRSMMNFVDPIKTYEMFGVQQEGVVVPRVPLYYTAHEEFAQVIIEFIVTKFHETSSDEEKIMLLTLADMINGKLMRFCNGLFPLACAGTKHENDDVAFAAYTLLYRKMSAKLSSQFTETLVQTVFEALLHGLDRFPENSLCIIVALTKLLQNNGKVITDKQLEELNTKILANMSKPAQFFDRNVLLASKVYPFNNFYKLGKIFGERMKPYLPKYRVAIFGLGSADLEVVVKLKNGVDLMMETNTSPQRFIQYSLLGKSSIGEEFEPENLDYARELLNYCDKMDDEMIWSTRTVNELHALFGNVFAKILQSDNAQEKLRYHVEAVLNSFSSEVFELGRKYYTGPMTIPTDPNHRTPIPPTSLQFVSAMQVWRQRKEGKVDGITQTDEEFFNFSYSDLVMEKMLDELPKDNKLYSEQFNDIIWDDLSGAEYAHYRAVSATLQQLSYQIIKDNLLSVLDLITEETDLLDAFHVLLAYAKNHEVSASVILAIFKTYRLLKEKFSEETQCFYLNTMASILSVRLNGKNIDLELANTIRVCSYEVIFDYAKNNYPKHDVMMGILAFSILLDHLPITRDSYHISTFDVLYMLLRKSPLGVYNAMFRICESSLLFANHPRDDPSDRHYEMRLHTLALLGYHFGMHFIKQIGIQKIFSDPNGNQIQHISPELLPYKIMFYLDTVDRSAVQPHLIERMERFYVLCKVYASHKQKSESELRFLNLYNAAYFETETVKEILRTNDKLMIMLPDLEARVKTWDGIYDLNSKHVFLDVKEPNEEPTRTNDVIDDKDLMTD